MSNDAVNQEQIEYWNEVSGPKWVAMQEDLDTQLGPLQEALMEHIGAQPGQAIIDVGCGCGASSLELARRVGETGSVTGADISAPMLARARERAAAEGLSHATFIQADAQVYSFDPGSVDFITSRFGIMFFEDPAAAFANLRTALKPGGRITFMCWRPFMENPWMAVPIGAAAEHVELPVPGDPFAPGPFSLADQEHTTSLLEKAGFTNIFITPNDQSLAMGGSGDLDASVDFVLKIGPLSRIMAEADTETVEKVRGAVKEALAPFNSDDGIKMDFATWLVNAENPG
jgi:SAM-dependent methyltransferase